MEAKRGKESDIQILVINKHSDWVEIQFYYKVFRNINNSQEDNCNVCAMSSYFWHDLAKMKIIQEKLKTITA